MDHTFCNFDVYNLSNCIVNFEKYTIIKEIGIDKGSTAVVFRVYNKNIKKNTVVKIQVGELFESAARESKIGCLVNKLNGFVHLYNYWICDNVPKNWRQTQSITKQEEMFWSFSHHFYLEMEMYEGDLDELLIENDNHISLRDKLSIWIELINALLQAFNAYNFAHNDIKLPNIFYKIVEEPRQYLINDRMVMCDSIYYPAWGDFGLSRVGPEASQYDDVIFIGNMMIIHTKGLNLPPPYKEYVENLYEISPFKREIVGIKPGFSYELLLDILMS
jgi:serine/threonine protein kinase